MLYSCELGRPVRFAGNDAAGAGADARLTGNTESADGPSSSRPAEQGGRSFRDASTYRLAHTEASIHCEPISSAMHGFMFADIWNASYRIHDGRSCCWVRTQ